MPEINYILAVYSFYANRELTLQKYTEITGKEERKSNRLTWIIHQVSKKSRLLFNILTVVGRRWTRKGKESLRLMKYVCYEKNFLRGKKHLTLRTLHGLKFHLWTNLRGQIREYLRHFNASETEKRLIKSVIF